MMDYKSADQGGGVADSDLSKNLTKEEELAI